MMRQLPDHINDATATRPYQWCDSYQTISMVRQLPDHINDATATSPYQRCDRYQTISTMRQLPDHMNGATATSPYQRCDSYECISTVRQLCGSGSGDTRSRERWNYEGYPWFLCAVRRAAAVRSSVSVPWSGSCRFREKRSYYLCATFVPLPRTCRIATIPLPHLYYTATVPPIWNRTLIRRDKLRINYRFRMHTR